MKKFLSSLCATAIAVAVAAASVVPVNAAPIFVPRAQALQSEAGQSNVIQVQDGFRYKKRMRRGNNNWNGNNFRRNNWNGNNFRRNNWNNNNFRRSGNYAAVRRGGNYGWYNGYRGYPYQRRGYRYYNGFWFPGGAFIAGALIGGAIANNNRYYNNGYGGGSHVQWCYDRYRSYRAYDNTFQPYNGPRQQCYSPYR